MFLPLFYFLFISLAQDIERAGEKKSDYFSLAKPQA